MLSDERRHARTVVVPGRAGYEDELIDGLAGALLGAFTGASTVIVDPSLKPRVSGTV